jgi:anti-sigma B factor antagonist
MKVKNEVIIPPEKLMGGPETSALKQTLCGLLKEGIQVILDLSKVRWINSAGLGLLISTHIQFRKCGSSLILVNPSPKVQALLRMTKLASVFEIRNRAA